MKPSELVLHLRRIAAAIDNSQQPHKHLVALDLKKLLARIAGQCWRCHKNTPDKQLDGNRGQVCNLCNWKLNKLEEDGKLETYIAPDSDDPAPCLECGTPTDNIDNVCNSCLGRQY